MDKQEAIEYIKANYPDNHRYEELCEALDIAIDALEKIIKIEQIIQGYYDNIDIWNGIDAPYIIDKIEEVL